MSTIKCIKKIVHLRIAMRLMRDLFSSCSHLFLLRIILNSYEHMAQCNHCGTSLSSSTTRALKVHHNHCQKNAPMRFKELASRVPKPQKHVEESEVIFCAVIPIFEQLLINNVQDFQTIFDLAPETQMEVDIHLEVAPMPEFIQGASVCLFLYIVNQLVTYDFIRNLRPQTIP